MTYFEDESMTSNVKECLTPTGRMHFYYCGGGLWDCWLEQDRENSAKFLLRMSISSNLGFNVSCAALYAEYLVQSKEEVKHG